MIRTKKTIDLDIKIKKQHLNSAIENSIDAEKRSDGYIATIKGQLSELSTEICFENTLEGKVTAFEQKAFKKIDDILKELCGVTGKNYGGMNLTKQIFIGKAGAAYTDQTINFGRNHQ